MRALLLDLDDTLLDDRAATRRALRAFLAAHFPTGELDEAAAALRWRSIMARHWERYERDELTFEQQRRERVREFLSEALTDAEADLALAPYLDAYQQACTLLPDVTVFLERTRHLPRVVVTNGERSQQLRKLARAGIDSHFRGVVTPVDCGACKPQPEMFLAAARLAGVAPGECMMIGDDFVRDIAPAQTLGMKTYHLETASGRGGILGALAAIGSQPAAAKPP